MVDMSIDPKHLSEACPAIIVERLWEPGVSANPIFARQLSKWSVQIGRPGSYRCFRCRRRYTARGICSRRCSWCVGGESLGVVHLGVQPSLHKRYILRSRDCHRSPVIIEPYITVSSSSISYGKDLAFRRDLTSLQSSLDTTRGCISACPFPGPSPEYRLQCC